MRDCHVVGALTCSIVWFESRGPARTGNKKIGPEFVKVYGAQESIPGLLKRLQIWAQYWNTDGNRYYILSHSPDAHCRRHGARISKEYQGVLPLFEMAPKPITLLANTKIKPLPA